MHSLCTFVFDLHYKLSAKEAPDGNVDTSQGGPMAAPHRGSSSRIAGFQAVKTKVSRAEKTN